MGRPQHVRKPNNVVRQKNFGIRPIFSKKSRLATPARKSKSTYAERRKVHTPVSVSVERRGSLRLSPINESPDHRSSTLSEKRKDRPPDSHKKVQETFTNSVANVSTNRDSTSDMIMPSGVSSYLLDCMDSDGSPVSCWSSSDSSLPSPELFRTVYPYEEALEFPVEEVVELHVKNSTLLDVSHAVNINMRQPPNLSSILEFSRKCDDMDYEKRYPVGNMACSFALCSPAVSANAREMNVSREEALQTGVNVLSTPFKQPQKTGRVRPIKCRKKVTFHRSVVTQNPEQENEMTEKSCAIRAVKKAASEVPGTEKEFSFLEINSDLQLAKALQMSPETAAGGRKDGVALHEKGMRNLSHKISPKQARFFDFSDSTEKNSFLQKKQGQSIFLFPSKPPIVSGHLTSEEMEPVYLKFKNSEIHDPDKLYEVCWIQLAHEGETFFNNSHLKKVVTKEGVFYEDFGKVTQFHGQVFFPISERIT